MDQLVEHVFLHRERDESGKGFHALDGFPFVWVLVAAVGRFSAHVTTEEIALAWERYADGERGQPLVTTAPVRRGRRR